MKHDETKEIRHEIALLAIEAEKEELACRLRAFRAKARAAMADVAARDSALERALESHESAFGRSAEATVRESEIEVEKASALLRRQAEFADALLELGLSVREEDALWESFCLRIAHETGGELKVVPVDQSGHEMAAIRAAYTPLLAKRHADDLAPEDLKRDVVVEIQRVFRITEGPGPPEKRASRRIGKTFRTPASIAELCAALQARETPRKRAAWPTPQVTPPQTPRAKSREAAAIHEDRNEAKLTDVLKSFGSSLTPSELVRRADEFERRDDLGLFDSMISRSASASEPPLAKPGHSQCTRAGEWESVVGAISAECGPTWFIGPRVFKNPGMSRIPGFRSDVLLDNCAVRWMRPEWSTVGRLTDRSIYFCAEELRGERAAEPGCSPIHVDETTRDRRDRTLASIPPSDLPQSFHFCPASLAELCQCRQAIGVLAFTSQKERDKLARKYPGLLCGSPDVAKLTRLFVCESDGNCTWMAPLIGAEIWELVGAYLVRLQRMPTASLLFPDLRITPTPGLRHLYCFLFPATQARGVANPRPDFLVQYDLLQRNSDSRGDTGQFLSERCAWTGCSSASTVPIPSINALHLCEVHAAVFADLDRKFKLGAKVSRRRDESVARAAPVSQFSENEPESVLVGSNLVGMMPQVRRLLDGTLKRRADSQVTHLSRKGLRQAAILLPGSRRTKLLLEIAELQEMLDVSREKTKVMRGNSLSTMKRSTSASTKATLA